MARASRSLLLIATLLLAACTTVTSNLASVSSPRELPGYSQSYDRVFGAAVDAVSLLSWEVTVAQKDVGLISAKTPTSLWTYGDKVTIRVFRPDSLRADSLVRIGFTSGTDQAYDWGKNNKNQNAFYDKINAVLKPVAR